MNAARTTLLLACGLAACHSSGGGGGDDLGHVDLGVAQVDGASASDAATTVDLSGDAAQRALSRYAYMLVSGVGYVLSGVDSATGALSPLTMLRDPVSINAPLVAALSPSGNVLVDMEAGSGVIASYAVDVTTGALTFASQLGGALGPPAFSPSGSVVYVPGSTAIQPYTVNATTGALTALGTATTTDGGSSLVIHPNGHFLYLANENPNGEDLTAFTIAADGSLTALSAGFPIATGQHSAPAGPVISPDGKLLAVPLTSDGTISGGLALYTIDGSTGALTPAPGSPYAVNLPRYAAFTLDGKFLYVTSQAGPALVGFSVDQGTGALTPLSNMPASGRTSGITVDPTGRFLYIDATDNAQQGNTFTYAIGADGSLTESARIGYDASQVLFFGGPGATPKLAPVGAYVLNAATTGGTVSPFTTAANGQLTSVANSPAIENGVATVATNDGRFLYALSSTEGIHAYAVGTLGAGTLAELGGSPTALAGGAALAIAPDNTYLYVTVPSTNYLYVYRIGTNGALSPYDSEDGTTYHLVKPSGLAVHPSGQVLWVADTGADQITVLFLNVGYGNYTTTFSTGTGSKPSGVAFSPDGEHGFVTLSGTGQVASYQGFGANQAPTATQTYAVGSTPLAVVADGTSRYVYVASSGTAASPGYGSTILGFSMTPTSAVLTPLSTPSFTSGARPIALAADPAGQFLLAACAGVPSASVAGALSAYTIGAGGLLTPITGEPAVGSSPVGVAITPAWH